MTPLCIAREHCFLWELAVVDRGLEKGVSLAVAFPRLQEFEQHDAR